MTPNETTTGGPLGKVAGKVKQAAGGLLGDKDLEREGRLQEASGDAEVEATERSAQAGRAEDSARLDEERAAVQRESEQLDAKARQADREDDIDRERHAAEREAQRLENAADRVDPETR